MTLLVAVARTSGAAPSLPLSASPATDRTLEALIKDSLAVVPELAQARATATAQRERPPQARSLPDPTLQLGIQNDGFRGIEIGHMENSYVYIGASQTLPWPGKRRLRGEVAEADARQAERSVERVRLTTEAEVRRAYLDLLLARDRLALLDRLEAIWRQSAASARARYESGQGAQSDVLRSQLELNRLRQRRFSLRAEERVRLQALNRLRRRPLDEPIATPTHVVDLRVPAVPGERAAIEHALAASPELQAARLAAGGARSAVALARKDYLPDFTVSAGVMIRGGDFPPMWQLGFGGPLPIWGGRKQSRAISESRARVVAAESGIEAIEQVLRLRVKQRRAALAAVLETIGLYKDGLLVQSETTAQSTLAQYRVGRTSFASVLEANSGFIADQDTYLQALAEAQRIAIATAELSLDPVGVSAAGGTIGGGSMPGAGGWLPGGATGAARTPEPAAAAPPSSSSSMSKM